MTTTMLIRVRIFDSRGSVKEAIISTKQRHVMIHQIKQCLQARLGMLGSKLFITSGFNTTLYEDNDLITQPKDDTNILLLAFIKNNQQSLGFRVASATARRVRYEKMEIDLDHMLTCTLSL